jgi:hypothetical protein
MSAPETRTRPRPPKAALPILFLLLLSAAALGVAGDRLWLTRAGRLPPFGMPAMPPFAAPSKEMDQAMFAEISKQLRLTPAQEPRARELVDRQIDMLIALRNDVRPRIDSIFQATQLALDSLLTAEQRIRRDSLLAKMAPFMDSVGIRRNAPR